MCRLILALLAVATLGGCAELRGRKKIQEGNAAYKAGDFVAAAARFDEAAAFVPHLPLLWLNRGYACRELIVPGATTAVNQAAGTCALTSFKRLRELAPEDPRGDRLYVQTLLDLGDYKTIERTFSLRHEANPRDLDVILVLQQVYSKTGRWRDALAFYRKGAALRPQDAEAHYAVGTFIWQVLQTRGGGNPFGEYDPRARPDRPPPPRPPNRPGDVIGSERLALAEEGIRTLDRAIALRPRFSDALTYRALLYRQQSYALFDDVPAWERVVGQAIAASAGARGKP
jgi:tetratricopeptide (TPR) repeat protein